MTTETDPAATERSIETVVIFSPVDFEKVQRHTETYYLSEYCSAHFDTHVVTPSSEIPGVSNHHFNADGILGVLLLNVVFLPLWAWLVLTERPDVVYCYPEVVLPALVAQVGTDARVVFDVRAEPFEQREEFLAEGSRTLSTVKRYLYRLDRLSFHWILGRSDLVVTLSEALAGKLSDNYELDRAEIHLLPQGVDTTRFAPVDGESADGRGTGLSMVYVGTINELRGLDRLVEAVASLRPALRSQLRLDLIGGGDEQYVERLLADFEASAPETTVEYHGYVDHEAVPALAGRSDVAISLLPGLESYNVSSPAKVYEYLALGLPVLATDIPAHRHILTDGRDAIIVGDDDPGAVAATLETLVSDPGRIDRMSERARETALQHSWESRFSALFDRIQRL
jgi:glycosyltransferase involved in cell wall biosynthesis